MENFALKGSVRKVIYTTNIIEGTVQKFSYNTNVEKKRIQVAYRQKF
jgi:transposase-like protein